MTTVPDKIQALSRRKDLSSKVLSDEHRQHLFSKMILCLPYAKTTTAFTSIPADRVLAERVNTACKT